MNYSLREEPMAFLTPPRPDPTAAEDSAKAAELYRLIADTIPHMVWTAAADGWLDFFNRRCHEYTGMARGALEGWGWKAVVHPEDWERCLASWTRALQSGERYEIEYRLRRADGTYRWHHGSAVPLRDAAGRPNRWFGTCTDIEAEVASARILEEMVQERSRELGASEQRATRYAQDVRRLMHQLVTAQESERRRVADDLHDLIGQSLTALGLQLTALRQRLGEEPERARERIDAMKSLVETTIDAIRGVMTDLRPPGLEEYGLSVALRAHAKEFSERTGMKAAVSVEGALERLPHDAELALFRIAQEALTNAAKHSGGTRVSLALSPSARGVRLVVEDDGRGFPDPVGARGARRGGWGLPAMRERVEAHGGELRVEFPGSGTRVVVEFPAGEPTAERPA
ncbi:MAG: PAS domain-containing protein [Betaproteobacteria bacterium]|nr:PAS domain-containing protein [Betaproteobacteria bacterium]